MLLVWQTLLALACSILHLAFSTASSEVDPPHSVLGVLTGALGLQVELNSHA